MLCLITEVNGWINYLLVLEREEDFSFICLITVWWLNLGWLLWISHMLHKFMHSNIISFIWKKSVRFHVVQVNSAHIFSGQLVTWFWTQSTPRLSQFSSPHWRGFIFFSFSSLSEILRKKTHRFRWIDNNIEEDKTKFD